MTLYHYTSIEAVMAILQRRTLWFTDIRYLNDSSELQDGVTTLVEATKKWRGSLRTKKSEAKGAIGFIVQELNEGVSEGVHCSFSFSRSFDQLSQWRAYGRYIIEFEEKLLSKDIPLHGCIYDSNKKSGIAFEAVSKSIEVISQDMKNNFGCIGIETMDEVGKLYELAATFKNEGFREENEVRALIKAEDGDEMNFRPRGELIIPFLEIPFSLDAVRAVYVGPMNHQHLALNSLEGFIAKIVTEYQEETGNIEFDIETGKSSIPWRHI